METTHKGANAEKELRSKGQYRIFVFWRALRDTGTMNCSRTKIHTVHHVSGSPPLPSPPTHLHHTRDCNVILTGQHEPLGVQNSPRGVPDLKISATKKMEELGEKMLTLF